MSEDEDRNVLAAEYVLGTLDLAERDEAERRIASEPDFAALVQSWERRLGELHALGDAVEPPPEVWDGIRTRLPGAEPSEGLRLPEVTPAVPLEAPPQVAPVPPPLAADNVVDLTRRLRRWRDVAVISAGLAAALAAVIVTVALEPDLLPESMQPEPEVVIRTVEKPVEVPAPAPAPPRYVAVLQSDAASPAFIITVDPAARVLTARRVSAEEQAGKSYELWLVSDRFPAPRSLGLVGASEFTQTGSLAPYEPDTIRNSTYAVSLEPEGGSPTGAPTGPVLWAGKLVEATPPGRT
jgi:anti-sigma-K factor RskA